MLTCTMLSQNGEGPDPIFFGDLSFLFQRPQWTGVDFPATSLYLWINGEIRFWGGQRWPGMAGHPWLTTWLVAYPVSEFYRF